MNQPAVDVLRATCVDADALKDNLMYLNTVSDDFSFTRLKEMTKYLLLSLVLLTGRTTHKKSSAQMNPGDD